MNQVLLLIFLLIAIVLVTLIMLQDGKHADMRPGFSAEHSAIFFSSSNYSNYVTGIISVLAFLFFIFSLILGNISNKINAYSVNNNVFIEQNKDSIALINPEKEDILRD